MVFLVLHGESFFTRRLGTSFDESSGRGHGFYLKRGVRSMSVKLSMVECNVMTKDRMEVLGF